MLLLSFSRLSVNLISSISNGQPKHLPGEKISSQFVNIDIVHVDVIHVNIDVFRCRCRRKLFLDVVDDLFDGVDGGAAVDDGRQVSKAVHLELVRKSTGGNSRNSKFETN